MSRLPIVDHVHRSSGWPTPELTLQLQRPTRANTVLLTPSVAGGNYKARATKVKITINGKISGEVEMIPRDDRKTEWVIPKNAMIRRIEVEVLERSPGKPTAVGFAEVELQYRKKTRKS